MEETATRIERLRTHLGERLVILGHHYQSDEVIRHADFVGDSLKLSRVAASRKKAEAIVFCGVRFMAETADILSGPDQRVFLPNSRAGCPMADMARPEEVRHCWSELARLWGSDIIPITYVNSSAELKDFCGRAGGAVCTSSNAEEVMTWALDRGKRVLFFPDRCLGLNTAHGLGLGAEEICTWNRESGVLLGGGQATKVILWNGFCFVHNAFSPSDIERLRREIPGIKVVVHPECTREVVQAADDYGSTEKIIECISNATPGSAWAVGTEIHLVKRLAALHPDKTILSLNPIVPPCFDMGLIDPANLLRTLEVVVEGGTEGLVQVEPEIAVGARRALERMPAVTAARELGYH